MTLEQQIILNPPDYDYLMPLLLEQQSMSRPKSHHDLWREGSLRHLLWSQTIPIYEALRALESTIAIAIILCARQFGKSVLGVICALEDAIRNPDSCVLMMGPDIKQTVAIVAPRIKMIARNAPPGFVRRSKSEGKWYVGPRDTESEIVIGGFDQNSGSQRGKTLCNIYIEEIVDANPDDFNESMRSDVGPALLHAKRGRINFLTTLPKVPDHPFISEYIPKARLSRSLYSYDVYANRELSREQFVRAADLAGCKLDEAGNIIEKSVDWLREYENKVVRDPRVVAVPAYDDSLHVSDTQFPPHAVYEMTFDFGGVTDKTACGFHFYDWFTNHLKFFDELSWDHGTPTAQIVVEALEREALWKKKGREITNRYSDCPGQTLIDLNMTHNYQISPVSKYDWQSNLNNLNSAFRNRLILIDPVCKLLTETLRSGQLNKQRTDFARTEALGHCDMIAMAMYALRAACRDDPYAVTRLSNESDLARVSSAITGGSHFTSKGFGKFRRG